MSKAIRTILSLVIGVVLLSALTMAQAGGNNADKDKNKERRSRLGKAAFWRHHKDADKNAKPQPIQAAPKQAQAKTTQVKTVSAKQTQAKAAQVKPASTKQTVAKKGQKQEQHASNMSKTPAKKASANKTKPQAKAQESKTVSAKQ
jgi:hypothetical protein